MSVGRLFAFAAVGAALLACESALNLDVSYTKPADGGSVRPAVDAAPGTGFAPTGGNNELEGCPCDMTQGLGCCVSSAGKPFCTTDKNRCDGEQGALFRCFGPDALTESVCCWNGAGAASTTAYAADCKERPTACTASDQCPNEVECRTQTCRGVLVGACGVAPPACPPGTDG